MFTDRQGCGGSRRQRCEPPAKRRQAAALRKFVNRRDFFPFGEDIAVGVGGRSAGMGYGMDSLRQRFTGYQKDEETGLDFAQARYYANSLGRFQSADPLYYQVIMGIDPQQLNLYAYTRNNPLKWVDPSGERLFLRGDINFLTTEVLYQYAGGRETFNQFFEIVGGQVVLKSGADLSSANVGVQELASLVNASENFVFFAGANPQTAINQFDGFNGVDKKGNPIVTPINQTSNTQLASKFNVSNYLVGTNGRVSSLHPAALANGDPVFATIAYNTAGRQTQTGIDARPGFFNEIATQISGLRGIVQPVSLFIHEAAENMEFARIGPSNNNYQEAHSYAQRREAVIRNALGITGGFAGGVLGNRPLIQTGNSPLSTKIQRK